MGSDARELILGVDGGGTGTTAWLATAGPIETADGLHRRDRLIDLSSVIGRGSGGPSNVMAADSASTTAQLRLAIDAAFHDAGLEASKVSSLCLALAGVDRRAVSDRFRRWALEQNLADQVIVTNDALPVLYAADVAGIGVAVIAGTGSICIGRDEKGRVVRSGGWGHLLGDEGSAYGIAVDALKAVMCAVDGRGAQTELTQRCMEKFALDDPRDLIERLHAPPMAKGEIAGFAREVFAADQNGDSIAKHIIRTAAKDLATLVESVVSRSQIDRDPITLACTGGVLLNQPSVIEQLRLHLEDDQQGEDQANRNSKSLPTGYRFVSVPDPVQGALQIASRGEAV